MSAVEIYARLQKVAFDPLILRAGIDRFLTGGTEETCRFCGQANLVVAEVLSGGCERCRQKWLTTFDAWDDEMCRCSLPAGWRCSGGVHHDAEGRAVARRGLEGRTALERCPARLAWRERQRAREVTRKRPVRAGVIDVGELDEEPLSAEDRALVETVERRARQAGLFEEPER